MTNDHLHDKKDDGGEVKKVQNFHMYNIRIPKEKHEKLMIIADLLYSKKIIPAASKYTLLAWLLDQTIIGYENVKKLVDVQVNGEKA